MTATAEIRPDWAMNYASIVKRQQRRNWGDVSNPALTAKPIVCLWLKMDMQGPSIAWSNGDCMKRRTIEKSRSRERRSEREVKEACYRHDVRR